MPLLPRLALLAMLVSPASAASTWTISTFAGTGIAGNGGDSEAHRVRVLRQR